MPYQICNIRIHDSDKILLLNVRIPIGFYLNAKGLLGQTELKNNTGMLFKKCNSIHMLGMKIPLDIIYLSKEGTILKCVSHLKPWRFSSCLRANMTLELAAGTINKLKLTAGMKLDINNGEGL